LPLVRTGLTRQCSVHTEEMMKSPLTTIPDDLPALKRLAQFLDAAGRLAEIEGRTNYAARIYLDCARVGNEVSRGGVGINRLVGLAVESIGIAGFARTVPALTCEEAEQFSAELLKLDAQAVTFGETMDLEQRFQRESSRGTFNPVAMVSVWWTNRKLNRSLHNRNEMASARRRLMALELQLRCEHSKSGKVPESLDALVGGQLSSLPLDPFSGKSFVYHPQGTNWLLYSVGPDGRDDGGMRAGQLHLNRGDLFFDAR
jgi:hypothetical protein